MHKLRTGGGTGTRRVDCLAGTSAFGQEGEAAEPVNYSTYARR